MLDVKIGEIYIDKITGQKTIYPNKTRKYLLPCFKEFGEQFMARLNNVFKVAAGIGDIITESSGVIHKKHIFILFDTNLAPKYFIEFLKWIIDQPMYEDDYVFGNIQTSKYHMIVLRIPEKFQGSLEAFKAGKYSEMFTEEVIYDVFKNKEDEKKVLTKAGSYRIKFTRELNKIFGTDIKAKDWQGELDFPLKPEEELFNHHLKK